MAPDGKIFDLKPKLTLAMKLAAAFAITYYGRSKDTIAVTGLGETTFTSDMIVWQGRISLENYDKLAGYRQMEKNQQKVAQYLKENGVSDDEVPFSFINSNKNFTSVYSDNGNYIGSRFVGYGFSQNFTITSYKGYDPELADGRDLGAYPTARSLTLGVEIQF